MSEITAKKRIIAYDIIRCIAIFAVIMIHSSAKFIERFEPDTLNFQAGNFMNGLSRLAVPLFIMLSGALLLREGRDCSIKTMCRQALNIGVLLVLWSVMYALAYEVALPMINSEPVVLKNVFLSCILGNYHLWYLYMLIGLYLITPIIKEFVKKGNEKIVLWFILLSVVFQFAVTFTDYAVTHFTTFDGTVRKLADSFRLDFVCQFTAYYLAGWYITNAEIKKKHRAMLYAAGAISLVFGIVGCALFSFSDDKAFGVLFSNLSLNVFLYSVGVFTFVYYKFRDKDIKHGKKIILTVSKYSFGIYLIHDIFLALTEKFIGVGNALLYIPLYWIIAFVLSLVSVFIISKIPIVKKLVRG